MADYKYTILINCHTGDEGFTSSTRQGGFSESYWHDVLMTPAQGLLFNLLKSKAAMLPKSCNIVGVRVSDPERSFRTRVYRTDYPGLFGPDSGDLPSVALQMRQDAASGAVLRPIFRGLPDNMVKLGEYKPDVAYEKAISDFADQLGRGWYSRTRAGAGGGIDVLSITQTETGWLLQTAADVLGVQLGSTVTVTRPKASLTGRHGGNYKVSKFNNLRSFELQGWKGGQATRGKVRLLSFVNSLYIANKLEAVQAITRKAGRPFFQFSGRASR